MLAESDPWAPREVINVPPPGGTSTPEGKPSFNSCFLTKCHETHKQVTKLLNPHVSEKSLKPSYVDPSDLLRGMDMNGTKWEDTGRIRGKKRVLSEGGKSAMLRMASEDQSWEQEEAVADCGEEDPHRRQ